MVKISVVIATYDRTPLLLRLLAALARQTLSASAFEVVVVDDGSPDPVKPQLETLEVPYSLRVIAQANAGPAAARHRGIEAAHSDIIVIVDDDMHLPETFLAAHAARHEAGFTVVLGHIRPAPELS